MSFPAKYDSTGLCPAGCQNRIHAGDPVTYNEDHQLVHASCVPVLSKYDMHPGETVCPRHWLIEPCHLCDD